MDGDLCRHLLPPFSSSDPETLLRSCGADLTRSTSSSSSITVDNTASKVSSHNCCFAADTAPFPDKLTRWTNQKHTQYLNFLEASFVKELHASSLQNNTDETCKTSSQQIPHDIPRQSLAPRDGCWKKISLERISPLLESTADSHLLAGIQFGHTSVERGIPLREPNTFEQGLLCDEGVLAGRRSTFSKRTQNSLEKKCFSCSSHPEVVASTTEITDQNFMVDEVDKSSCMPVAKRLKTAAAETSIKDQVVPFGKFHPADALSSNSTSEIKGLELLSELPESFRFPKSDLHYFLRGS